jgi:hypothetical protein
MMQQPVKNCRCNHRVTKHTDPFADRTVRRDQDRAFLVTARYPLEEQVGGDSYDTLVFTGNRSDYQLDIVEGMYRITHLALGGQDGTDTVGNIEALRFADQTVEVDQLLFV